MSEPSSLEAIYFAALEKTSGPERAKYLDAACTGNPELRHGVERMLAVQAQLGSFLESSSPVISQGDFASGEKIGDQIGPYKLLQEIGEGGMGTVYMAEQIEPVARKVALKIIKPDMNSRKVIARFEAERQALALMDHPNIAKILDAGTTEHGRPYFVMELVKGVPIIQHCDQHRLTPHQRLELFIAVCQAVQHAHQKGIIHRDLKPTNILVADYDNRPVAKIIDFGVAKAIGHQLTERTMFTEFGQVIGTVEYMSPEQAKLNQLDIDTRTDIYSLGVLLYELLIGETPFDGQRLRSAAFDEMLRIIREEEPPRPSTRLSSSESLPSIATNRQFEPKKLTTLVSGDLDWIVMRALEKDRTRRYETAAGMAQDIQRYLTDQPVEARQPTRAYRLKKFIRRNKVGVLAGVSISIALIAGLVLASFGLIHARLEASRADHEAEIARTQEQIADTQANKSKQVATFLKEMLKGVEPSVSLGRDTSTLRDILDSTAAKLDTQLKGQPEIQAEMQTTLGEVYNELQDPVNAEPLLRQALATRKELFGDSNLAVAETLSALGDSLNQERKYTEAEDMHRQVLAMRKSLASDDELSLAATLSTLANDLWRQHTFPKMNEAAGVFQEALELQQKQLGHESIEVVGTLHNISNVMQALANRTMEPERSRKQAECERLRREGIAILQKNSAVSGPEYAGLLMDLGLILHDQGKFAEAESVERESIVLNKKLLGAEHSRVSMGLVNLGQTLQSQGKSAEAEDVLREAVSIQKKTDTRGYWTLTAYTVLGDILRHQDRLEEAEPMYPEAWNVNKKLGASRTSQPYIELVGVLHKQGKLAEIDALLNESGSTSNPSRWLAMGEISSTKGNWPDAIKQFKEAVELTDYGDDWNLSDLGIALVCGGKPGEYDRYCHDLLDRARPTATSPYKTKVARVALLAPLPERDQQRAIELASQMQMAHTTWGTIDKALLHYRKREFQQAADLAAEALADERSNTYCQPAAIYLQSMAYAALQQDDTAKKAFQRAEDLSKALEPSVHVGWEWHDTMMLRLIRAEAAAALGVQDVSPQENTKANTETGPTKESENTK